MIGAETAGADDTSVPTAIATITRRGCDRTSLVWALVPNPPDGAIPRLRLPVRPRQQADDARTGWESHRECKEEERHFQWIVSGIGSQKPRTAASDRGRCDAAGHESRRLGT